MHRCGDPCPQARIQVRSARSVAATADAVFAIVMLIPAMQLAKATAQFRQPSFANGVCAGDDMSGGGRFVATRQAIRVGDAGSGFGMGKRS